jgi:hypothetical protein
MYRENAIILHESSTKKKYPIGGEPSPFSLKCWLFGHVPDITNVKHFLIIPSKPEGAQADSPVFALGCLAHCKYCLKSDVFAPFLFKGWHSEVQMIATSFQEEINGGDKDYLFLAANHEKITISVHPSLWLRDCESFPSRKWNPIKYPLLKGHRFGYWFSDKKTSFGNNETRFPQNIQWTEITRKDLASLFKPKRLWGKSHKWVEMYDAETQESFLFCMNSFKTKDIYKFKAANQQVMSQQSLLPYSG